MFKIRDSELIKRIQANLKSIGRDVQIDEAADVSVLDGYADSRAKSLLKRIKPSKAKEAVIHDGDSSMVVMIDGPADAWLIPVGLSRHDNISTAIKKEVNGITKWNSRMQHEVAEQVDEAFLDNAPVGRVGT